MEQSGDIKFNHLHLQNYCQVLSNLYYLCSVFNYFYLFLTFMTLLLLMRISLTLVSSITIRKTANDWTILATFTSPSCRSIFSSITIRLSLLLLISLSVKGSVTVWFLLMTETWQICSSETNAKSTYKNRKNKLLLTSVYLESIWKIKLMFLRL